MAGPQEHIFDLPQERITGDILHGYGPRRGNLERLLRYWRPIMRKPGGFRRCLLILADHPELYPLPNICAWLHHETTGKWPNEGCHHPGMRNCRSRVRKLTGTAARAAGRAARRAIPGKELPIISNSQRMAYRIARKNGSVLYRPLNGDQGLIDYKANSFSTKGRWSGAFRSFLIPGERPAIFHHNPVRAVLWNLATPGGSGLVPGVGTPMWGGGMGGVPGGVPGGMPGSLGAVRGSIGNNPQGGFRCPGGFEHGGRFTNRQGTNCGSQLFAAVGTGFRTTGTYGGEFYQRQPREIEAIRTVGTGGGGAPTGPIRTVGTSGTPIPEGTLGTTRFGAGSGGGTRTVPGLGRLSAPPVAVVGRANPAEQENAVEAISTTMGRMQETPDFPVYRLIRRDSTILVPLVPTNVLARQQNNADLSGSIFVTRVDKPEKMGEDEVPLLGTGVRALVFSVPGGGTVRLNRKKPISPEEAAQLRQALSATTQDSDLDAGYGSRLQRLADLSGGKLDFGVTYPGLRDPMLRVIVEAPNGAKRRVPLWVYKAFLAPDAPARPKERTPYKLISGNASNGEAKRHFTEIDTKVASFKTFSMEARNQAQKKAGRTPAIHFPGVR